MNINQIYLDNNATTTMHIGVRKVMSELMLFPINASSVHAYGRYAKNIIEDSRYNILKALNLKREDGYQLTFTSSGTEANNLIIKNFKDERIIVSSIEHPSIIEHMKYSNNIEKLKVTSDGLIDIEDLKIKLAVNDGRKILVSVMYANNETGVIQPIKQIAELAKTYGAFIHSDMAQAFGKCAINIKEIDIDFTTISAHKFGGPVGIGGLISKGHYNLKPDMIGGGQEKGLRSGTENAIAIAGFAKACEYLDSMTLAMKKTKILRDELENEIYKISNKSIFIGQNAPRIPNTSLIIMPGVKSQIQLMNFDLTGIAVSSGSACSSGKVAISHVLTSMGVKPELAECAIRVSLSYDQKKDDINLFIKAWKDIFFRLTEYKNKRVS